MKTNLKLADAYYRLSVEEANEGESSSITNQRSIVRQYCEDNGITIVNEFVDDGFSGSNFDRPGFNQMIAHLNQGRANMVITKYKYVFRNFLNISILKFLCAATIKTAYLNMLAKPLFM